MPIRIFFVALFAANLFGWPQVTKNQSGRASTSNRQSDKSKGPVPPTHIVIDPPIPALSGQIPATAKQEESIEKPLPRFARPEWVIVYVTVVYCFITWLTLRKIKVQAGLMREQLDNAKTEGSKTAETASETLSALKRQADSMDKQIGETKRSVDSLINSERAWVVIAETGNRPLILATSAQMENNQFAFVLLNKGRTVARIVEIKTESIIADPTTKIPEYPTYPERPYDSIFSERNFAEGTILVPGESSQSATAYIDQIIDDQVLRDINGLNKRIYVYGFIRYFDFANQERRNQFCYLFIPAWSKSAAKWSAASVQGMPRYNTHS